MKFVIDLSPASAANAVFVNQNTRDVREVKALDARIE